MCTLYNMFNCLIYKMQVMRNWSVITWLATLLTFLMLDGLKYLYNVR